LGGTQEWKRTGERGTPIFSLAAGQCLGVTGGKPKLGAQLRMVICDDKSSNKFDFIDISEDDDL